MLDDKAKKALTDSKKQGWVLEPDAKRMLESAGMAVPEFTLAKTMDEALQFVRKNSYPVVAKIVSPQVVHKSDVGGVVVGIDKDDLLAETYKKFSAIKGFCGMLVEESVSGLELIVGAKVDYQFGPVILLGIGGTGVEIYKDTTLRMAPLRPEDIGPMIKGLKAHKLLEGYRGAKPVDMEALTRLLVKFSEFVMEVEPYMESIDLNPVMCTADKCYVADARIMLKK
jgi:acyl-CoA synthetase (NDP forming)